MRNWELCKHTYNDFHNYTSLKNEKTKEVYEVEYDFFISLSLAFRETPNIS